MKRRTIERVFLVLTACGIGFIACSTDSDTTDATGTAAAMSGPTSAPSSTSTGGAATCAGGIANGMCDDDEIKASACGCPDCAMTALCIVNQCIDDGACTIDDACTCKDCGSDAKSGCGCNNDGMCDSFTEGCACLDCSSDPNCKGQPAATLCPDATCTHLDACTCLVCHENALMGAGGAGTGAGAGAGGSDVGFCNDPKNCVVDDKCSFDEGCLCEDCKGTMECAEGNVASASSSTSGTGGVTASSSSAGVGGTTASSSSAGGAGG